MGVISGTAKARADPQPQRCLSFGYAAIAAPAKATPSLFGRSGPCGRCRVEEIHERILSVNHDTRRIAYTITQSPFGFEFHAASWQVAPHQGGAKVTLLIDVLPDQAASALDGVIEPERETIVAALQSRHP